MVNEFLRHEFLAFLVKADILMDIRGAVGGKVSDGRAGAWMRKRVGCAGKARKVNHCGIEGLLTRNDKWTYGVMLPKSSNLV